MKENMNNSLTMDELFKWKRAVDLRDISYTGPNELPKGTQLIITKSIIPTFHEKENDIVTFIEKGELNQTAWVQHPKIKRLSIYWWEIFLYNN